MRGGGDVNAGSESSGAFELESIRGGRGSAEAADSSDEFVRVASEAKDGGGGDTAAAAAAASSSASGARVAGMSA